MTKTDELRGPSCLTNAADDEPLFVLRANDELAPGVVRTWAALYRTTKVNAGLYDERAQAKWREAITLANQMDAWRLTREPS